MGNTFKNIAAIAGKEIRGYFTSPLGWVILGLFGFMFSFFFYGYVDYCARASMQAQFGGGPPQMNINRDMIRPLFSNISVVLLFMAPMLTMRTYSEEKRSGTIELLLTSPVTDWEITFGKFFGAMGMFLGIVGVTMLYFSVLFIWGNPEVKPVLVGYLGLLLLGGSFVAIGLFISSLTKNQMVAGAATFVAFLTLWIVSWGADSSGPIMGKVLQYLSITEHLDDFAKGIIDTKHVIFYLSLISFGLFLTVRSLDTERWKG
jgi:ABC-2 type transport system permease protein